eukprot:CAMPEP_0183292092 /NCGR_PEP_ID=MMETSP0160_2-20130417/1286_1 /TAXON_ID=2839 ORGANISM="Odontella Sinensis, Strain Grunow 1884" /NCGR_SAMPLE_ID=MMETSP0160_2 /ASSEMBLY_ACC=CAM_ASM_000250 /LENGTH=222 /DNA_ID=CAMNT_0025453003 /DNA_START=42 /DNA_END=710 /DNA_ORIENTATION=+
MNKSRAPLLAATAALLIAAPGEAFQASLSSKTHDWSARTALNAEPTSPSSSIPNVGATASIAFVAAAMTFSAVAPISPANAVSGGGLDYAGIDISGQDFSKSTIYKGKDFTQVIAKGTNFAGSNLQGCRFYKAYLVNTDFTSADLRGASLEDTSMDGASLLDVDARGAYFGQSLLDVNTLENGDFTDAQIPLKTLPLVCDRDDVKGTNPKTGVDTRESLMCP